MKLFQRKVSVHCSPAEFKAKLTRVATVHGLRLKMWDHTFSVSFPPSFPIRRYASAALNGTMASCDTGTCVILTSTAGPWLILSIVLIWGFMLFPGLPIIASSLFRDEVDLFGAIRFAMAAAFVALVPPVVGIALFFAERSALAEKVSGLMEYIQSEPSAGAASASCGSVQGQDENNTKQNPKSRAEKHSSLSFAFAAVRMDKRAIASVVGTAALGRCCMTLA